jgi:hypothetical protein
MTAADGYAPTTDEHDDCVAPTGHARAKTISVKRLAKRDLERGRMLYPSHEHADTPRPKRRLDCVNEARRAGEPCPFVSCKHHLYLDVSEKTGSIKLNFPDLDVWEMPETCALDVADRGGLTLEEVGEIMNLTRERVRQLENRGIAKLLVALDEEFVDADEAREMFAAAVAASHADETDAFSGACGAPDLTSLRSIATREHVAPARIVERAPRPDDARLDDDPEYLRIVASNARRLDPRFRPRPGVVRSGPGILTSETVWGDAPESLGVPSQHPADEAESLLALTAGGRL